MNNIVDYENNDKENNYTNNIGLIVKKYRSKRGITRQVLANKSGISLRYLAQLESGKANPTISIITNMFNNYKGPNKRFLKTAAEKKAEKKENDKKINKAKAINVYLGRKL